MSPKGSLSFQDLKKWGRNTLVFSSPAILAALMALQGGQDLHFAAGAAYSALIGSVIDLVKKFTSGESV